MMKKLKLTFFALFFLQFLFAQTPQGFNYQAVLRDNTGTLLQGETVDLRISILQGSDSGPSVYSETHNATTNMHGLVNLKIGQGSIVSGDFSIISWGTDSYFIQIELDVNSTGFVVMGVNQLLSVPYAMYAQNSGTPGPTGAQGEVGPSGVDGVTGPAGADGATGPQGDAGITGADGTTGPTGADGVTGPQGDIGPTGADGATGEAGLSGDRYATTSATTLTLATGAQTLTIEINLSYTNGQDIIISNSASDYMEGSVVSYNPATGELQVTIASITGSGSFSNWGVNLNGTPGIQGEIGPTGPQGIAGNDGATGPQGPQGVTGAAGADGVDGVDGVTGPQGIAGNDGATGPQGPQGVAGADGADGATGPQGIAGNDGATGPQGPQGVTGAAGADGSDGVTGAAGADGVDGVTGPQGPQGIQGVTGTAGADGDDGVTGPQGSQGPQGVTGAAGADGTTGPQGQQGVTGADGALNAWGKTGNAGTVPTTNFVGTTDAQALVIKTNNTENIRITSAGNVGVGTDAPPAKFVVLATGQDPSLPNTTSTGILRVAVSSDEGLDIGKMSASPYCAWLQSGYLGTADPLTLQPSGGNVGIGVISPAAKLDIAGTIKIADGSQGTGKILVSDANGLAGWQSASTVVPAWRLTGNSGLSAGTNFIGNTDSVDVYVKSNNYSRMVVKANGDVGIGTETPTGKLEVHGTSNAPPTDPLFEVKDVEGNTVFAVYPEGVQVYVEDGATGSTAGFTVSGRDGGTTQEWMRVTPDSIRMYIKDETGSKSTNRGGFAVSGKAPNKGTDDQLLHVSPDTTRVYTRDTITGFGIRNIGEGSGNYMKLGRNNYFIGHESGDKITTGIFNSFIGFQSGLNAMDASYNVFMGYRSGFTNDGGNFNTFLGFESGYTNTGSDNTFIGYQAGKGHQSGGGNIHIGSKAGKGSTNGSQNIFIGENCGQATSIGAGNIFLGVNSGFSNLSGNKNILIGNNSGYSNTNGFSNIFIGDSAGFFNTIGFYNIFFGNQSGLANNSGEYNIFFGYQSGRSNVSGDYNTFLGYKAGYMNTATSNIFLGYYAGYGTGTGAKNVFMGNEAGRYNQTGSNNVFIGDEAGGTATAINSSVMIGKFAGQNKNDNANSNVYIGNLAGSRTVGGESVYVGQGAGYFVTGSNNVFVGYNAGFGPLTASNQVRLGNGSITSMYCQGAYTGVSGGTYQDLYVWNDGRIAYLTSSRRYKSNILDLEDMDWLFELRPVSFTYKTDATNGIQYGLIAEEVEAVNPLLVMYNEEGQVESVTYSKLIVPMLKAIQDQQAMIEKLQNENSNLKASNSSLSTEIQTMKADIETIKTLLKQSAVK